VPFRVEDFTDEIGNRRACKRCACTESFLDEFIDSKSGEKVYQCSDIDWCNNFLLELVKTPGINTEASIRINQEENNG